MAVALAFNSRDGGWHVVTGVPGWESHCIRVRAEVINGEPRVTALRIEPSADRAPSVTGLRLRSLPLRGIARLAAPTSEEDMWRAFADLEARDGPKHDSRASISVVQFVEAWRIADAGPNPATREVACKALGISSRTYDRYRRRAVDLGLMPDRKARG